MLAGSEGRIGQGRAHAVRGATFGLVIGGLLGGPIAGRLIRRNRLAPEPGAGDPTAAPDADEPARPITSDTMRLGIAVPLHPAAEGFYALQAAAAEAGAP